MPHEPFEEEPEFRAFCLRRMETVRETDCQACFEGHEQLQAGYQHRSRCVEPHWIESAAHDLRFQDAERQHLSQVTELGCIVCFHQGRYTPAEIHHLRSGVGMSQRASNYRVLPLCPLHHRTGGRGTAFHAGRRTWETRFGSEEALWEEVQLLLGEESECLAESLSTTIRTSIPDLQRGSKEENDECHR